MEGRMSEKYSNPSKCPKCNHALFYEGQVMASPPSMHCPACGYRDWDMKGMKRPNWDLAVSRW